MTLELNDKAICDEMLALTALRQVARGGDEGGLLLTADMLPGLRNMARLMFAETVMEMAPLATDCTLGEEDPSPTHPYNGDQSVLGLKVEIAAELPSGIALAAKRHWEHAVAAKVLEAVATERDNTFASMLRLQHTSALEALRGVLGESAACGGRIEPHWW